VRILHIGKYFAPFKGGVETYLRDLMTGQQRAGACCACLVHNHVPSLGSKVETVRSGEQILPVTRAGLWLKLLFTPISPAFRHQLARLVREFRPDVIHVHLPNPSACWLLTVGPARKLPLVVHWHSDVITGMHGPLMKLLYALYRPLERRLLQHAGAIVATSRSYLRSSESLRDYPDKCHVVPLGLDPLRFAHLREPEPSELTLSPDLQVLAVGRLTYYKGFGYLVRAAAQLDGVQVHVVGGGERERELKKLAARLNAGRRVIFLGRLGDAELAARFRASDCLCLPSIERTEAFGLVLLEAMMFSKATVVSDVRGSGMGWVVDDGETGIKVPPRDVNGLVSALQRLRDDRGLARRLGEAGRRKFDRLFAIDHSVQALQGIYNGLVYGSRGEGPA